MTDQAILAIDQGTHASRAVVFDRRGRMMAVAMRPVALQRPAPRCVEQDGKEILASVRAVMAEALSTPAVSKMDIVGAALATQRSSVIAWDRVTGEALSPVLSWQDRRAADWLASLPLCVSDIKQRTGLPASPHYGASKLQWLLNQAAPVMRSARSGCLAMGPLASFLLHHLLSERPHIVDHANAARTLLWNIKDRDWDPELLDLFKIPSAYLPACQPICHPYGELADSTIPLVVVNGDQGEAVHSLGRLRTGTVLVNIGTGAFVLLPCGSRAIMHPQLLTSITNSQNHQASYALEGTINGAGAALAWAGERWGTPTELALLPGEYFEVDDPPVFLNSIGGLGSPWWREGPKPDLLGATHHTTSNERVMAILESIVFLIKANLDEMTATGLALDRIIVSGGLSRLDVLCQRLADLTDLAVYRPAKVEATARGSAWLAFDSPKYWPRPGRGRNFVPRKNDRMQARYSRFRAAMETS